MMKKGLAIAFLMVVICACGAMAEKQIIKPVDGIIPDGWYFYGDYLGGVTDIEIQEGTTEIGRTAFANCRLIESVVVPGSVKKIGWYAFRDCYALKRIELREGIEEIGDGAFRGCRELTEIYIPSTVTRIGGGVFFDCDKLQVISISPDNPVFEMVDGVLYDKVNREMVYYPPTLENSEYTVPDGTRSIGPSGFSLCMNLKSVFLPDSLEVIGSSAFSSCGRLEQIIIPSNVKEIGADAFSWCSKLKSIIIPEGIERIRSCAFSHCRGLESVVLPSSLVAIEGGAFTNCKKLDEIAFPDGHSYYEVRGRALIDRNRKELISYFDNQIEKRYQIPKEIRFIADYAFSETLLTEISIPDGVEKIGMSAFSYCTELERMSFPDSVVEIGMSALDGCSSLKEVKLPNKLKIIEFGMFLGCENLEQLNIPDSVVEISDYALDGKFKCLVIPESVEVIGSNILFRYSDIERIEIRGNKIQIADDAFSTGKGVIFAVRKGSDAETYAVSIGASVEYLD